MCVLGLNVDSFLFKINNLTSLEFAKSLLKIREFYCDSEELSKIFNNAINSYDLSKKEIRKILEETEEYNEDFIPKLERSMKSNKKDNTNVLSRKLGKICKRESTENPEKQENTRINHVYNLILDNNLDKICNELPRIVMILDNPKAHKTDFIRNIAKLLNIYLVELPPYSPEFAPVEMVFKIMKREFRRKILKTKDKIEEFCLKTFESKCDTKKISQWFVEKYIPVIC